MMMEQTINDLRNIPKQYDNYFKELLQQEYNGDSKLLKANLNNIRIIGKGC